MKELKHYITEKLVLNKSNSKQEYHYHPKSYNELRELIIKLMKDRGKDANLNDIDTSAITDMSWLFDELDPHNIDISDWNVSNVTNMCGMFYRCEQFNSDISSWNVRRLKNAVRMFYGCEKFNQNLDTWTPIRLIDMENMFCDCINLLKLPEWFRS